MDGSELRKHVYKHVDCRDAAGNRQSAASRNHVQKKQLTPKEMQQHE